ncbi:Phosphoglucan [Chlorella vulgaris]
MSAHGAASLQRLSAPRSLSGSSAAPRPMSRGPSCALRPLGSLRQTLGSGTSGGNASGSGSRLRSCSLRALAGSEVSSSPAALASSTQGVVALCGPPPPVTSSLGGAGYAHGNMGGSNRPSSSSSSSSSSTSPESSSSADWNGAEEEPPLDHRSSATTSELLRAVLRRRAERLSRQEDPGLSAYLPASQPAQQQQQQQQPPEQPPASTMAQQQQSQQAQQQAMPPPRYPLPSLASRNGAAHASTSAASQKGEGTARLQGAPAHLNGATAPSHSARNGAGPPPQPQPQLKPVAAPEQRVVRQNAAGLVREDAVAQRKLAAVRFWLKFKAEWGQRLKVVGSHQELGGWALATAPELKWSQGDNWHTTAHLPAGGVVEYKYVLLDHSGNHPVAWQQGNNSVLALRPGDELVEVFDNWGADPGAKMVADGGQPITRENRLLSWASEMEAQLVSQKQDLRRSRMELASAQEEAREARLEAERFKAQLRAMEKEKIEAANHLHHARALNEALQSQLTDTTASFQEALRTAADILSQIDEVSPVEDGPAAALPAGAASAAMPPPRSFVAAEQAEALAVSVEGGDCQQAPLQQASGADAKAWGQSVQPERAPGEAQHEQHKQLKAGLEAAAVADAAPHAAATDAASPTHTVAKAIEAAAPAAATAPPSRSKGGVAFVPSTKRRRRSRNGKSKSSRK